MTPISPLFLLFIILCSVNYLSSQLSPPKSTILGRVTHLQPSHILKMCVAAYFFHVCPTHHKKVVHSCSNPTLCQSVYKEAYHYDDAECGQCLGFRWPIGTFDSPIVGATPGQGDHYEKQHADMVEGLINWAVLWLADEYGAYLERNGGWTRKDLLTSTPYLMDHAIKTIFKETSCKSCNIRQTFAFTRCACPGEAPHEWALANPVSQYRQRVARDVYFREVEHAIDSHQYDQTVQKLRDAEATRPPRTILGEMVLQYPPLPAEKVRQRRETVFQRFASSYDNAVKKVSSTTYTFCAGSIVNVLAVMMASDPGLPENDMMSVLDLLSTLFVHPEDTHVLDRRQFEVLRPLVIILDKFICSTDDVSALMNECCKNFVTRFERVEDHHRNTLWASYVQSYEELHKGRLKHYSVKVSLQTLDSTWMCPICHESQGVDPEVIQLRHCNHRYHLSCLLMNVQIASTNKNICCYCRSPWDIFPTNDQRIYKISLEDAKDKDFLMTSLTTQIETPDGRWHVTMPLMPLLGDWLEALEDIQLL